VERVVLSGQEMSEEVSVVVIDARPWPRRIRTRACPARCRTRHPAVRIPHRRCSFTKCQAPIPSDYRAAVATHWTLGCDAAEPRRIAAFWARALGYVDEPGYDEPDGASIIDPDGRGPAISFLKVPEGKRSKNRMHIDIRVAGEPPWDLAEREGLIRAKVQDLVGYGATIVQEHLYGGEHLDHVVMQDPEGNEFCVA
jgi:hypothetical protein